MLAEIANRLITPSVKDGTATLRALLGGGSLRLHGADWEFEQASVSPLWTQVPYWRWSPYVEDSTVEWMLEGGVATRSDGGTCVTITSRGRALLSELDASIANVVLDMSELPTRQLKQVIADLRTENPDADNFVLAQLISQWVLLVSFGEKWLNKHVLSNRAPTTFFRNGASDDAGRTLGMLRIVQLAEMIFNMQYIDGVEQTKEMIGDGDIEGGFAELEVGKLLHVNKRSFRFVRRTQRLGSDYDFEIDFDGTTAYADAKCKIESTAISERTVLGSLGNARSQLPKDKPGLIFVKVPQSWNAAEESFVTFLRDVGAKFFRGTKRIVSVKFHSSLLINTGVSWSPRVLMLELPNPDHRFNEHTNWNVFSEMREWPDHWVNFLEECSEDCGRTT